MNDSKRKYNLFATAALIGLLVGLHTQAQTQLAPSSASSQNDKSDKVDIKDLENQYWAPKDTDFSVVQNRAYSKDQRLALSLQYGLLLSDSYSTGSILGVSGNYFFNERMGVELDYQKANLQNNDTVNYFLGAGTAPSFTRMTDFYGVGFTYVPIYAKMSLLNHKIIYFDFAITPLIGMTDYDQIMIDHDHHMSSFTYGFDISQYFFFAKNFAIRMSIRDQFYNAKAAKFSTDETGAEGAPRQDNTISSFQFLLGLTVFF
jgi:outer membrane beta-barrel protein